MFRKSKTISKTVAQQIRRITSKRVLAATEVEYLDRADDSLMANLPAETEGEEGGTSAIAAEFVSTGIRMTVALTTDRILGIGEGVDQPLVELWWHQVDRAIWDPESLILKVVLATEDQPLGFKVSDNHPLEFLSLLRDRVENSVIISETISLTSAENVRVAVRRDQFGELLVQAIGDPGVDLNHPLIRSKVDPVVARLREVSGAR